MSTRTFTFQVQAAQTGWVPAVGTFANISVNTLAQAAPSGYPTADLAGPFANWCGAVFAPEYGAQGAYITHGSGHLTMGAPLWHGTHIFDLATLTWTTKNRPSQVWVEGATVNTYYEYPDGCTYPAHTYDSLGYQSPANGGGASGSMLRFWYGGSTAPFTVHRFDLSQTSLGVSRVIDNMAYSGGSNYPMIAFDGNRNGWWTLRNNGNGPLAFVSATTYAQTYYASAGYNVYGDNNMVYLPQHDGLLCFGRVQSDVSVLTYRYIQLGVANPVAVDITAQVNGSQPTDSRCGGVWSTILGCVVSYTGVPSYTSDPTPGTYVYRLTVPASPTTGAWTWARETLTGASGATPVSARDSNNAIVNNGTWGRFVEVPSLSCFLYAGSVNGPVQAWRLQGM